MITPGLQPGVIGVWGDVYVVTDDQLKCRQMRQGCRLGGEFESNTEHHNPLPAGFWPGSSTYLAVDDSVPPPEQ